MLCQWRFLYRGREYTLSNSKTLSIEIIMFSTLSTFYSIMVVLLTFSFSGFPERIRRPKGKRSIPWDKPVYMAK